VTPRQINPGFKAFQNVSVTKMLELGCLFVVRDIPNNPNLGYVVVAMIVRQSDTGGKEFIVAMTAMIPAPSWD
jgi:hypothetical protein